MLRAYLPKKITPRTLLIILMPSLVLQGIIAYVFLERYRDHITQRLSRITAGEIAFIAHSPHTQEKILEQTLEQTLSVDIVFRPSGTLPGSVMQKNTLLYKTLHKELSQHLTLPFRIDTTDHGRTVVVHVQRRDGLLSISLPLWRTYATRGYIFLVWSTCAAALLIALMLFLLKNQIRPVRALCSAMDAFGRGRDVPNFVPRGSLEVRRAGLAFLRMKTRLQRAVEQRTLMLAGVSHDMRTLLTRFQLQLSLLPQTKKTKALKKDTFEMERILNAYLDFAQTHEQEDIRQVSLKNFLKEISADIPLDVPQKLTVSVRPNSFRRAIRNLITNALTHAKTVRIKAQNTPEDVEIFIEDDGPGIPEPARDSVFRPFYQLENNTPGRGLGLAIARDIVQAHGGTITLTDSTLGGLCVHLRLPAS